MSNFTYELPNEVMFFQAILSVLKNDMNYSANNAYDIFKDGYCEISASNSYSQKRSFDEKKPKPSKSTDAKKEKRIENLNRKIEYGILQQIIYREETRTVPNSRFRKIVHLSNCELIRYPFCCVLTLVCFLILFEPNFARVGSIYNFFKWAITMVEYMITDISSRAFCFNR